LSTAEIIEFRLCRPDDVVDGGDSDRAICGDGDGGRIGIRHVIDVWHAELVTLS